MRRFRASLLLLLLVMLHGVSLGMGYKEEEGWRRGREEEEEWEGEEEEERERGRGWWSGRGEDWFLLHGAKPVIQTEAGEMRVVRNLGGRAIERPMHIGFITMEPKTLFIPQYVDSSLILFIRRGEARVGLIYKNELAERRLKMGDIYRIPAGSAFYLVNTGEGQRLHVICSIDPSESLGIGAFQSFFIGGGTYPTSVLAGFEPETLATAFNVTMVELRELMTRQREGPIVFVGDSRSPSDPRRPSEPRRPSDPHRPSDPRDPKRNVWNRFLQLNEEDRLSHLKRMVNSRQGPLGEGEEKQDAKEQETWSWRKLLTNLLGEGNKKGDTVRGKSPDSYNIYDRRPDFSNNYGWSVALDEGDYHPLRHSGIGVFLVNLTAGSMMAPHVNPRATEYGIVLRGSGTIQIVFPNGTQALNTKVSEGDVFWVPRYFPFCQIASRTGPFEFFGFTTSARKNRPQFLVGASSLLQTLRGPELAASFGVAEEDIVSFVDAQREAIILPSAAVSPPDKVERRKRSKEAAKVIEEMKRVGSDMLFSGV